MGCGMGCGMNHNFININQLNEQSMNEVSLLKTESLFDLRF